MTRRMLLACALLAAVSLSAAPPCMSMRWIHDIWQPEGKPTYYGVAVFMDIPDTTVRAFEVRVRWKTGLGEAHEADVIALRGYLGEALATVETGPAFDIQVDAWSLRRSQ